MFDLRTRVALLIGLEIGKLKHPPTPAQVSLIRARVWELMLVAHKWPNGESNQFVEDSISEAVKLLEEEL